MEFWPIGDRNIENDHSRKKGRRSSRKFLPPQDYLSIEPGLLNAATLHWDAKQGQFKWSTLPKNEHGRRLSAKGFSGNIFPATRPPSQPPQKDTVFQRAEQGANFIRTFLPDVHLSTDIIRDEIAEDTQVSRDLEKFNPHAGNLLAAVQSPFTRRNEATFLAFPMGELNRGLNMSFLNYNKAKGNSFKPSGVATRSFATPIQQIETSPFTSNVREQAIHLAIRTFASIAIFNVRGTSDGASRERALMSEVAQVTPSDVGNRAVVDIKICAPAGTLLINDQGAVYNCDLGGGAKVLSIHHELPSVSPEDKFWKLAINRSTNNFFISSNKTIRLFDLRSGSTALNVFSVRKPGELLASLEGPQCDDLVRCVTTDEILWFDTRFTRRPLLGYKHGRHYDRRLQVQTCWLGSPLTFLSSLTTGLVTVYDVTHSQDDRLLHLNDASYSLPHTPGCQSPFNGILFHRHPDEQRDSEVCMYQLDAIGSIYRSDLYLQSDFEPNDILPASASRGYEWSDDVKSLEEHASTLRTDLGPLGATDLTQVDLRDAYLDIFKDRSSSVEKNPDMAIETVERMPFFWQELDTPPEQMLTMFDIAFRSGEEPEHASRADFFTESSLNSSRGYRAVSQRRIDTECIARRALWYQNILPTLQVTTPDISEDPGDIMNSLRRYDLASHSDRDHSLLQKELEACEQLAVDLTLCKDVFSPTSLAKPAGSNLDDLETMSLATEAMSLAGQPPPVQFGHLHPILKSGDHYLKDSDGMPKEGLALPIGVRLLLKEWDGATNPDEYVYFDPYDASSREATSPFPSRRNGVEQTFSHQPQRPPVVVAAKLVAPALTQSDDYRRTVFRRQGLPQAPNTRSQVTTSEPAPSSQEFTTSTQVLPGPYGGRPGLKKKAAKKRMGGF